MGTDQRGQTRELQRSVETLQNQLHSVAKERDDERETNEQLLKDLTEKSIMLDGLQEELSKVICEHQKDLADVDAETVAEYTSELSEKAQLIDSLQEQLRMALNEKEDALLSAESLTKELEAKSNGGGRQLGDGEEATASDVTEEFKLNASKLDQALNRIEQLERENVETEHHMKTKLNDAMAALSEKESLFANLKQDVVALKQINEERRKEVDELKSKLKVGAAATNEHQRQMESLTDQLINKNNQLDQMSIELVAAHARRDEVSRSMEAMKEDLVGKTLLLDRLQQELGAANAEKDALKAQQGASKGAQSAKLRDLAKENGELKVKLEQKVTELAKAKERAADAANTATQLADMKVSHEKEVKVTQHLEDRLQLMDKVIKEREESAALAAAQADQNAIQLQQALDSANQQCDVRLITTKQIVAEIFNLLTSTNTF